MFSGLLCALTAGLSVFWAKSWAAALSVGATLCALPFFPAYGNSAWEHVPQLLLVTLAFAILTGRLGNLTEVRYPAALAVLTIAFWIRPDTLPLLLPLIVVMLRDPATRLRRSTYASLGFMVLMLLTYFSLHHHLYGQFVPNTYYLKVNPGLASIGEGVLYVLRSSLNSGIVLFLLFLPLLYWSKRDSFSQEDMTVMAAMLLQTAYICLVGGDAFRYGRFFAMVGPFAILLFWEKFWQHTSGNPVRLFAGALCLFGVCSAYVRQSLLTSEQHTLVFGPGTATPMPDPVMQEASIASYLKHRLRPEDGQIGLFTLGALAYYMPRYKVADFLGKADSVIAHEPVKWGTVAHNKWDIEHTLRDRHVAVVPFAPLPEAEALHILQSRQDFAFSAALQLDPYTVSNYTYRTWSQLGIPGTEGLLIRNDLLSRFPGGDKKISDGGLPEFQTRER